MYDECCQQGGGWVVAVVVVIIILIIIFIIQSQQAKTTTTPTTPAIVPTHDWVYAYNDNQIGPIEPFEPIELNSQIFPPNTQFVFDSSNSSFTLPPGSYDFKWSVPVVNTSSDTSPVGFGISPSIAAPNLPNYAPPFFFEGSIFESRHLVNGENKPRVHGHYTVHFTETTELQLREALGEEGIEIGTESGSGLEHAKASFSITKIDPSVALA